MVATPQMIMMMLRNADGLTFLSKRLLGISKRMYVMKKANSALSVLVTMSVRCRNKLTYCSHSLPI